MPEIDYKRSKDGKFAAKTAAQLEREEEVRSSVISAFVGTTGSELAKGSSISSFGLGAKTTPSALAATLGGIVGQKLGGIKGESIGKIIGNTLVGGLTAGVPGAVANGVSTAIGLKDSSKKSLLADLDKAIWTPSNQAARSNRLKLQDNKGNLATPALVAIDKAIANAKIQSLKQASAVQVKIATELDKAGLSESAEAMLRSGAAGASGGAIKAGLTGSAGIITGGLRGVAGFGMGIGATAGAKIGKKLGGMAGEVAGSTMGGAIGGAVSAALGTGGIGMLPGMAVGSAVGLSMVEPNKIISTAKMLGDAANKLTKGRTA